VGETLYDFCLREGAQALLDQWDTERNAPLTPRSLTSGSRKRVWWRCPKGHSWQTAVKVRTNGAGCPVCANRRLVPGENDLATVCPDLVKQWHPAKNGTLAPADLFAGTQRKVWWRCEKGHEWRASVFSRAGGAGCPVCASKVVLPGENDLASRFPKIAAQWDAERNGTLTPQGISPYSNRRVWWRCEKGHGYQAAVGARTLNGSGCPYCAGKKVLAGFNDLATLEPQVAAQWHFSLNGTLTAEMVTPGSHARVWWQCAEGHVWKAVVYSRAGPQKCGCPVCAGQVKRRRQGRYSGAAAEVPANCGGSRI